MTSFKLLAVIILLFLGRTMVLGKPVESASQTHVLRFAGEQCAVAPDSPQLQLGTEFTMMGWFYFDKITPGAILMGQFHNPWLEDPSVAYTIGVSNFEEDSQFEFRLSDGTSDAKYVFGSVIQTGQWVHVAATLEGGTMRIFVNGVEQGAESFSGTPDTNTAGFGIGGGVAEDGGLAYQTGFSGFMKQLSVWNKAFDATAITQYSENDHEVENRSLS